MDGEEKGQYVDFGEPILSDEEITNNEDIITEESE